MNKYQEALNNVRFYCGHANCDEYLNPKVFEELNIIQELVDKATPKKPYFLNYGGYQIGHWKCPSCDLFVTLDKYCKYCGQALDWSDEDDK